MPEILTQAQIDEYNEVGAIVVPNILSPEEVQRLRRVTDDMVEKSRAHTTHTDIYDLEDTHSAAQPRVRRIKQPHIVDPAYGDLVRHPRILAVLRDLWGPAIRFDTAKLNLKSAGYGAAVEWHQDWAFYPHTNDDLAAVGVMLDDIDGDNGPMQVVPGSHKGPVFDHHADGVFCGAIDARTPGLRLQDARACTGGAGAITIHHVRAVHGSAPNRSGRPRRFLLLQYRCADAWPLITPPADWARWSAALVAGTETLTPRTTAVPVRLPYPAARNQGSIYENQNALRNRYF